MFTCTFFGHKDTPNEVEPLLKSTLIDLIDNKNVSVFYVGNQGNFDFLVEKNLKILSIERPHIKFLSVLAYMPSKKSTKNRQETYDNTIYPDGLETVPPKYAISKRNLWMIERSKYVVTYVSHRTGGAAKFKELAEKKGKIVINLADRA